MSTLRLAAPFLLSLALLAPPAVSRGASGDLDPTFGNGGMALGPRYGTRQVLIDGSGGILTAPLQRHLANGALDTSFGLHGKPPRRGTQATFAVALQPDGKIVVLGRQAHDLLRVLRYHPDGSLDRGFGRSGLVRLNTARNRAYEAVWGSVIGVQSTGRIVFLCIDLAAGTRKLHALLPDGSIDTSFGTDGDVPIGGTLDMTTFFDTGFAVMSDDRIVVSAGATVVRLLPDGAADPTFGSGGVAPTNSVLPALTVSDLNVLAEMCWPTGGWFSAATRPVLRHLRAAARRRASRACSPTARSIPASAPAVSSSTNLRSARTPTSTRPVFSATARSSTSARTASPS